MRRLIYLLIIFVSLSLVTTDALAKPKKMPKPPPPGSEYNAADYLVLQSIGDYYNDGAGDCRKSSGMSRALGHFYPDHYDLTCDTSYNNTNQKLRVSVEVTKHAGADSDRWLLHELDAEFRTYYGIPGDEYAVVPINGNTILECGSAGWDYRWISGNKVIKISYNDAQMTKPEPLEVVKAYLAKHPSTITPFTLQQLRSNASVTKWIWDEIDRRLWLCDKWNAQFNGGGVSQADLMNNLVIDMTTFLEYRAKYFSVAGTDDITALETYLENKDITAIQTKLTEYKTWWNANKTKAITLP